VDDGERRALLDAWFRAYGDRVLAYLLHRTDPETAQDLVQEVFVIAFRKAAAVPEPPVGWLFATARRLLPNKNYCGPGPAGQLSEALRGRRTGPLARRSPTAHRR
jgi:hypothetical protein